MIKKLLLLISLNFISTSAADSENVHKCKIVNKSGIDLVLKIYMGVSQDAGRCDLEKEKFYTISGEYIENCAQINVDVPNVVHNYNAKAIIWRDDLRYNKTLYIFIKESKLIVTNNPLIKSFAEILKEKEQEEKAIKEKEEEKKREKELENNKSDECCALIDGVWYSGTKAFIKELLQNS